MAIKVLSKDGYLLYLKRYEKTKKAELWISATELFSNNASTKARSRGCAQRSWLSTPDVAECYRSKCAHTILSEVTVAFSAWGR